MGCLVKPVFLTLMLALMHSTLGDELVLQDCPEFVKLGTTDNCTCLRQPMDTSSSPEVQWVHEESGVVMSRGVWNATLDISYDVEGLCPNDWTREGDKCFFVDTYPHSWDAARFTCKNYSGDLVRIPNAATTTFLQGLLSNDAAHYHIGLRDRRTFYWLDETTEPTYLNWDPNQPDDRLGFEDCVGVSSLSGWRDWNCEKPEHFICENAAQSGSCPVNGQLFNLTRCFNMYQDAKLWDPARIFCQNLGGDLAIISNQETQDFLDGMLSGFDQIFYVGLRNRKEFYWLDDTESLTGGSYTSWVTGQPDDSVEFGHCISLFQPDGKWNVTHCADEAPFICEMPILNAGFPNETYSCKSDALTTEYIAQFAYGPDAASLTIGPDTISPFNLNTSLDSDVMIVHCDFNTSAFNPALTVVLSGLPQGNITSSTITMESDSIQRFSFQFHPTESGIHTVTCHGVNREFNEISVSKSKDIEVHEYPYVYLAADCVEYIKGRVSSSCTCEKWGGYPDTLLHWYDLSTGAPASQTSGDGSTSRSVTLSFSDNLKTYDCRAMASITVAASVMYEVKHAYGPTDVELVAAFASPLDVDDIVGPLIFECKIADNDVHAKPDVTFELQPGSVLPLQDYTNDDGFHRFFYSYTASGPLDFEGRCNASNAIYDDLTEDHAKDFRLYELPQVELVNCPTEYINGKTSVPCQCKLTNVGHPAGNAKWTTSTGNQLGTPAAVVDLSYSVSDNGDTFLCLGSSEEGNSPSIPFVANFAYGPTGVSAGPLTSTDFDGDQFNTSAKIHMYCDVTIADVYPVPNVVIQGVTTGDLQHTRMEEIDAKYRFHFEVTPNTPLDLIANCVARNAEYPSVEAEDDVHYVSPVVSTFNCQTNVNCEETTTCYCKLDSSGFPKSKSQWVHSNGTVLNTASSSTAQAVLDATVADSGQTFICRAISPYNVEMSVGYTPVFQLAPSDPPTVIINGSTSTNGSFHYVNEGDNVDVICQVNGGMPPFSDISLDCGDSQKIVGNDKTEVSITLPIQGSQYHAQCVCEADHESGCYDDKIITDISVLYLTLGPICPEYVRLGSASYCLCQIPFIGVNPPEVRWVHTESGEVIATGAGQANLTIEYDEIGICPDEWSSDPTTRTCLQIVYENKTWDDARAFCNGISGDLVRIEAGLDLTVIPATAESFFIGLRDRRVYLWLDEHTKPNYTNWATNEPNDNQNIQDCGGMDRLGEWRDRECNKPEYFICEKAPQNDGSCSTDWSLHSATASCFKQVGIAKIWDEARDYCIGQGGDLAKLPDEQANTFVHDLMKQADAYHFIGLRNREEYFWLNDTSSMDGFEEWNTNEPDADVEAGECVTLFRTGYVWKTTLCADEHYFICQMDMINLGFPNQTYTCETDFNSQHREENYTVQFVYGPTHVIPDPDPVPVFDLSSASPGDSIEIHCDVDEDDFNPGVNVKITGLPGGDLLPVSTSTVSDMTRYIFSYTPTVEGEYIATCQANNTIFEDMSAVNDTDVPIHKLPEVILVGCPTYAYNQDPTSCICQQSAGFPATTLNWHSNTSELTGTSMSTGDGTTTRTLNFQFQDNLSEFVCQAYNAEYGAVVNKTYTVKYAFGPSSDEISIDPIPASNLHTHVYPVTFVCVISKNAVHDVPDIVFDIQPGVGVLTMSNSFITSEEYKFLYDFTPTSPNNYTATCTASNPVFTNITGIKSDTHLVFELPEVTIVGCSDDYIDGDTASPCSCHLTRVGYPEGKAVWVKQDGSYTEGNPAAFIVYTVNDNYDTFTCRGVSDEGSSSDSTFQAKFAYGPAVVVAGPDIVNEFAGNEPNASAQISMYCDVTKPTVNPVPTVVLHGIPNVASLEHTSMETLAVVYRFHFSFPPNYPLNINAKCVARNSEYPSSTVVEDTLHFESPEVELTNCPPIINCTTTSSCTCKLRTAGYPPGKAQWAFTNGTVISTSSGSDETSYDFNSDDNEPLVCRGLSPYAIEDTEDFEATFQLAPSTPPTMMLDGSLVANASYHYLDEGDNVDVKCQVTGGLPPHSDITVKCGSVQNNVMSNTEVSVGLTIGSDYNSVCVCDADHKSGCYDQIAQIEISALYLTLDADPSCPDFVRLGDSAPCVCRITQVGIAPPEVRWIHTESGEMMSSGAGEATLTVEYDEKGSCPDGWFFEEVTLTCLQFVMENKTYDQAESSCQDRNAEVVILVENMNLTGMPSDGLQTFYTSLRDRRVFYWLDQTTEPPYFNWENGQPDDLSLEEDCGAIIPSSGLWKDTGCDKPEYFICEKVAAGSCSPPWQNHQSSCFKLQSDDAKVWDEARATCQGEGGDLAVITDIGTQQFVHGLLGSKEAIHFFGLKNRQEFFWQNETVPFSAYNNFWATGEPNSDVSAGDCVVIASDFKLSSVIHCTEKHYFICQMDVITRGFPNQTYTCETNIGSRNRSVDYLVQFAYGPTHVIPDPDPVPVFDLSIATPSDEITIHCDVDEDDFNPGVNVKITGLPGGDLLPVSTSTVSDMTRYIFKYKPTVAGDHFAVCQANNTVFGDLNAVNDTRVIIADLPELSFRGCHEYFYNKEESSCTCHQTAAYPPTTLRMKRNGNLLGNDVTTISSDNSTITYTVKFDDNMAMLSCEAFTDELGKVANISHFIQYAFGPSTVAVNPTPIPKMDIHVNLFPEYFMCKIAKDDVHAVPVVVFEIQPTIGEVPLFSLEQDGSFYEFSYAFTATSANDYTATCTASNPVYANISESQTEAALVYELPEVTIVGCSDDYIDGDIASPCSCHLTRVGYPEGKAVWVKQDGSNIEGNPDVFLMYSVNDNYDTFICRGVSDEGSSSDSTFQAKFAYGPAVVVAGPDIVNEFAGNEPNASAQISMYCDVTKPTVNPVPTVVLHGIPNVASLEHTSMETLAVVYRFHFSFPPNYPLNINAKCVARNSEYPSSTVVEDTLHFESPEVELTNCPPIINCTTTSSCTCKLRTAGYPPGKAQWAFTNGTVISTSSGSDETSYDFNFDDNEPLVCRGLSPYAIEDTEDFEATFQFPPPNPPTVTVDVSIVANNSFQYVVEGDKISVVCQVDGGKPASSDITLTCGSDVTSVPSTTIVSTELTAGTNYHETCVCKADHLSGCYDDTTHTEISVHYLYLDVICPEFVKLGDKSYCVCRIPRIGADPPEIKWVHKSSGEIIATGQGLANLTIEYSDIGICPDGWTSDVPTLSCLQYVAQNKTWDEARSYCNSHTSDLVRITSNLDLSSILPTGSTPFIGLRDRRHFVWLEETSEPTYLNWASDQPNDAGGKEDCVGISRTGVWRDWECDKPEYFVCEQPAVTATCPSADWKLFNQTKCFKLSGSNSQDFAGARAQCQFESADLAKISDQETQNFVFNMVLPTDTFHFIGLWNPRYYFWQNDSTSMGIFNAWTTGEPANTPEDGHCVIVPQGSYEWKVESCLDPRHFLCQRPMINLGFPNQTYTCEADSLPEDKNVDYTVQFAYGPTHVIPDPVPVPLFDMSSASPSDEITIHCDVDEDDFNLSISVTLAGLPGGVVYPQSTSIVSDMTRYIFKYTPTAPGEFTATCQANNTVFDDLVAVNTTDVTIHDIPHLTLVGCPKHAYGTDPSSCKCEQSDGFPTTTLRWQNTDAGLVPNGKLSSDSSSELTLNFVFSDNGIIFICEAYNADSGVVANISYTVNYAFGPVNGDVILTPATIAPHEYTGFFSFKCKIAIDDTQEKPDVVFDVDGVTFGQVGFISNFGFYTFSFHHFSTTTGDHVATCTVSNPIFANLTASDSTTFRIYTLPEVALEGHCPVDHIKGKQPTICYCERTLPGYPAGTSQWVHPDNTITEGSAGQPNTQLTYTVDNNGDTFFCEGHNEEGEGPRIPFTPFFAYGPEDGPNVVMIDNIGAHDLHGGSFSFYCNVSLDDVNPGVDVVVTIPPYGDFQSSGFDDFMFTINPEEQLGFGNFSVTCTASNTIYPEFSVTAETTLVIYELPEVELDDSCPSGYIFGKSAKPCKCKVTRDGYPQSKVTWRYPNSTTDDGQGELMLEYSIANNYEEFTCSASNDYGSSGDVTFEAKFAYGPESVVAGHTSAISFSFDPSAMISMYCDVPEEVNPAPVVVVQGVAGGDLLPDSNQTITGHTRFHFSFVPNNPVNLEAKCVATNAIYPSLTHSDEMQFYPPVAELMDCPPLGEVICMTSSSCKCKLTTTGYPTGQARWVSSSGTVISSDITEATLNIGLGMADQQFICQGLSPFSIVSNASIDVTFKLPPDTPPVITIDGSPMTDNSLHNVTEGDVVPLNCNVNGGTPNVDRVIMTCGDQEFSKDGKEISKDLTIGSEFKHILCICKAEHETGCYDSTTQVLLSVEFLPTVSSFTINDGSDRVTADVGENATVVCVVDGNPSPSVAIYILLANGTMQGQTTIVDISGRRFSSAITPGTAYSTDVYTCVATYSTHVVNTSIDLIFNGPVLEIPQPEPPKAEIRPDGQLYSKLFVIAHPAPTRYTLDKRVPSDGGGYVESQLKPSDYSTSFERKNIREAELILNGFDSEIVDDTEYVFTIYNGYTPPLVVVLESVHKSDPEDIAYQNTEDRPYSSMLALGIINAMAGAGLVLLMVFYCIWLCCGGGTMAL